MRIPSTLLFIRAIGVFGSTSAAAQTKGSGAPAKAGVSADCETCHKKGVKDEDVTRVHAHKVVKPLT